MKTAFFPLLGIVFLASCGQNIQPTGSMNISDDGVTIDIGGQKMGVSSTGVDINIQGNHLQVSDSGVGISLASLGAGTSNLSAEDMMQFGNLSQESLETENCQTQFDQLVKTFGNSYDSCFAERKKPVDCSANVTPPKLNIAVIFDASGSMGAKIGNETMMEIAKDELGKYISSLEDTIWWGVILYGHKGNSTQAGMRSSCEGIEHIGSFGAGKQELIQKINAQNPNGWTPIDASLQKAHEYLTSISGPDDQKIILLISDGKETCGGNPVETATKIAADKNTSIDVIGFNVSGSVQSELLKIAENGGGKYQNVKSRSDFIKVFADMRAFSQEIQCAASDASVELRHAVDALNTFYTCNYMAHEEEVKVVTNASKSCVNEIANSMEKRREEIEKQLAPLETSALEDIDNFSQGMEEVIKKFE